MLKFVHSAVCGKRGRLGRPLRRHSARSGTGWLKVTCEHTDRQADRPTDRPADRPAGRPTDRLTGPTKILHSVVEEQELNGAPTSRIGMCLSSHRRGHSDSGRRGQRAPPCRGRGGRSRASRTPTRAASTSARCTACEGCVRVCVCVCVRACVSVCVCVCACVSVSERGGDGEWYLR